MASQESDFKPSSGWEENVSKDRSLHAKIIDLANSKISLDSVLSKYRVQLEQNYSSTGWAFKGSCPFPDHNDKRPSFGYNPTTGVCNCLGCHRGGKVVEFIAAMEGRAHIDVAKEIVRNCSGDEILIYNSQFDFERFRQLLFDFADTVRKFKEFYGDKNATKYAKAVTWNLDVYIRKHVPFNTVVLDDLEARILKLKSQLLAYKEHD